MWPTDASSLMARQEELAGAVPALWHSVGWEPRLAGCWLCFPRGLAGPGSAGDPAWVAAVVMCNGEVVERHVTTGRAGAAYVPGLLSLRVGPLMERAVAGLEIRPDVLLVDATSRDHPRGAGLALHLGAELDVPTVGVTQRPLLGQGAWPEDRHGAVSTLHIGDTVVGCWVRTRSGARPIVVHPGWRVDLGTAVEVVAGCSEVRMPEPLRRARHLARLTRDASPSAGGSRARSQVDTTGPSRR